MLNVVVRDSWLRKRATRPAQILASKMQIAVPSISISLCTTFMGAHVHCQARGMIARYGTWHHLAVLILGKDIVDRYIHGLCGWGTDSSRTRNSLQACLLNVGLTHSAMWMQMTRLRLWHLAHVTLAMWP